MVIRRPRNRARFAPLLVGPCMYYTLVEPWFLTGGRASFRVAQALTRPTTWSLITKFTKKYICFYGLFNVRGA